MSFNLRSEVAILRAEAPWERGDRNARTLIQEERIRVVLVALKPGARLQEHHADGHCTIQTIEGCLRVHLRDRAIDLPAGSLLSLEPGVPHDVEGLEESAFLLTIA